MSIFYFSSIVKLVLISAIGMANTLIAAAGCSDPFMAKHRMAIDCCATPPMPSADLLPQQVVAVQLKALQDNDEKDSGIAIAFNFAAPDNKTATGPLDRFIQLVKNPVYAPLLNFKKCETNRIHIEGEQAQQIAIITDKNGNKAAFLFSLSRQSKGPYQGCWMTDSVVRLAYEEKLAKA